METGCAGQREPYHDVLSRALQKLIDRFNGQSPALILLQSKLWDEAGYRDRRPKPDLYPMFPVLPYLQRLEHYLLRPISYLFSIRRVLVRPAVTDPPSVRLFSDDPVWLPSYPATEPLHKQWNKTRTAATVDGQCIWVRGGALAAAQLQDERSGCPFDAQQRDALASVVRQREETMKEKIKALRGRMADRRSRMNTTTSDRQTAPLPPSPSPPPSPFLSPSPPSPPPVLVLRSVHLTTPTSRHAWQLSLNGASSLLASSYGLPYADLGIPPLTAHADNVHLKRKTTLRYINLLFNIYKHTTKEQTTERR
jgi:hypothetical protein